MVDQHLTDLQVGYRAAALLTSLQDILKVRLAAETDPDERKYLQALSDQVPNAALLLGLAVGAQAPDAVIRRGK